MTSEQARYVRASRAAHRAWANSQPQYVIPGVLDQVDAGTDGTVGVHLIERAPVHSPSSGGVLDLTTTRGAANPQPEKRGAPQKGV